MEKIKRPEEKKKRCKFYLAGKRNVRLIKPRCGRPRADIQIRLFQRCAENIRKSKAKIKQKTRRKNRKKYM